LDAEKRLFKKVDTYFFNGFNCFYCSIPCVYSAMYNEDIQTNYLMKTSKNCIFKTYQDQLNLGGFVTDKSTGLIENVRIF